MLFVNLAFLWLPAGKTTILYKLKLGGELERQAVWACTACVTAAKGSCQETVALDACGCPSWHLMEFTLGRPLQHARC